MGFALGSLKLLLDFRKNNNNIDSVLTLGRQALLVSPYQLRKTVLDFGHTLGEEEFQSLVSKLPWSFEAFLKHIGSKKIDSFDASEYEGATIRHDLNRPITESLEDRYDVVIDGGTLEHVFNFPIAVQNCMRMVKKGGHLLLYTPVNNYCGHGFYQFGPEIFYRVLNKENGFQIKRMIMYVESMEVSKFLGVEYPFFFRGPYYVVNDPAKTGQRVEMVNDKPTVLYVEAQKIEKKAVFDFCPQQSDFVTKWEKEEPKHEVENKRNFGLWIKNLIPHPLWYSFLTKVLIIADPFRTIRFKKEKSFKNKTSYRKIQL